MKIKMDTIYHLPTQAHEDDFLKQAEKQGLNWISGKKATENKRWSDFKEDHCVTVARGRLDGYCNKPWYEGMSSLPIIKWEIGFSKMDMQVGQLYLQVNGSIYQWHEDEEYYTEDLRYIFNGERTPDYDIVEVYPMEITPIWKRPETKYKVKAELTYEQAEKLGLELCEAIE